MNKGAAELLIYMAGRVIEDRKTEPDTIIDWRSEIFDYAYDSGSLGSQEPGRVHHHLLVSARIVEKITTNPMDRGRHASDNRAVVDVGKARHRTTCKPAISVDRHRLQIRHPAASERSIQVIVGRTVQTNDNNRSVPQPVCTLIDCKL